MRRLVGKDASRRDRLKHQFESGRKDKGHTKMISPHTPPGTKVVCIDDDPANHAKQLKPQFHHLLSSMYSRAPAPTRGTVYTVLEITPCHMAVNDFAVRFTEQQNNFYPLECFRVLELPRTLTALLETTPVLEDA